jgi:hypothetical protein
MPSPTRRRLNADVFIDVPLVRRFGGALRPVTRKGTYRVGQCQKCLANYGFAPLEAAALFYKQRQCCCGGEVRVTPSYCKVK